jgi:MFS family permease
MSEYWRKVRAFSPSFRRMLLAAFSLLCVWSGLVAVLYNLYLLRLGFDTSTIGLLGGFGALVWGLAALPAGSLSNRIGLRNSMQLGGGLYGLGVALALLVEQLPPAQWLAWLLGTGMVMNIGIAFVMVNAAPYIMTVTGGYERPYAFAAMAALSPIAAFAGSVLAGLLPALLASWHGLRLDQPEPYRLAMWAGPILCWSGLVPMFGADPGRVVTAAGSGPSEATPVAAARAPLGLLTFWALVIFLVALGEGAVRMFFNVLMDRGLHLSTAAIGFMIGAAHLLPIIVALALPLLLARWGTGHALLRGIVVLAACLALFALGAQVAVQPEPAIRPGIWLVGAAYLAVTATLTVVGTARDMFGQEIVLPRWRTSSQAAAMLGLALGLAVAGVVGGALIEALSFGALYLAGALSALAAAGLLFGYLHRPASSGPGHVHPGQAAITSRS